MGLTTYFSTNNHIYITLTTKAIKHKHTCKLVKVP